MLRCRIVHLRACLQISSAPPVFLLALALATAALCSSPANAAGPKPIELRPIQIQSGKVLGVLTADQKVIAYKGIPYAEPPVTELRWKPPQPVARWKHVLYAQDFGPHCIQFGTYPDMVFHDPGPSEDCLTLNVWTPADAKPSKKSPGLPVMVWIYGGGFVTGGTSESRQDGQFLAHRGVVVVSMNYRLGLFGFFAHPELTAESSHHASGNYGLMDQALALAWVRENIAAFGGDPNNITLFGESAGSFSVSAQMASPLAKDLFNKAIGESGAAFWSAVLSFPPRETVEKTDAAWADRVFGSDRLFNLRALTVDELTKAAMTKGAPRFTPDIDGYFLPRPVPDIFASGQQAHIPLMAGWNADEAHATGNPTAASFTGQARSEFGSDAASFLAVYPATTDAEALRSANDLAGDRFIAFSTWQWLEAQTRTGQAPVYRYFFALGSPGDRYHPASAGTFHSDDIEYVFGTLDSRPEMKIRPEDRRLSGQMQTYWVNFARTGDPNGSPAAAPGATPLPKWPAYSPASGDQVMRLDATPAAAPDPMRGRYLFLDSEWGKAAGN
jgi:para-nitrobenzyl esterase